ncbi:YqaA family protein [Litorimonas sp. WD9-15]|uniref:YqaA family protein n=1 Tax=Litorimonas sp. WD9-15 TaxID=3418716 RepID=UPI003D0835B1
MKGKLAFLERWYDNTKAAAGHKRAMPILCALSFAESSFFPIPVDVMIMPMVQAKPKSWWRIALWASVFSVLGGIFGYMLGMLFFETIAGPLLEKLGKAESMERFSASIQEHGGLWVFGAGFTPFPYKVITIMSGAVPVAFGIFVIASVISRTLRFFLVAGIVRVLGETAERWMKEHFGIFSIGLFAVLVAMYFAYKSLVPH